MAKRSYPAIPRASINDDVRAITEILEIGLGIKGQALDKFLTWNDLINKDIVKLLPEKVGSKGVTESAIDKVEPTPEPPDLTEPLAPSGFTVNDGIDSIILVWDNPRDLYSNHGYTEIWRHTSDNLANATMIGTSDGQSYIDHIGVISETRYYWIRFISDTGVAGPYNSATGSDGVTAGVVAQILADAAVTTSKLATAAVDNTKLAALAVDAAKLADSAVTSTKIANAAVGSAAIANLAVGNAQIANLAVTDAKIANATITGAKIANATITGGLIAGSTIVGANIADSTITNSKILNLSADKITAGTITGSTIQTAASGKRAVLTQNTNDLRFYDSSNQSLAWVGEATWSITLPPPFGTFTFGTSAFFGDQVVREIGAIGKGSFNGIRGYSTSTSGGAGVFGINTNNLGVGVLGLGQDFGVWGTANIGIQGSTGTSAGRGVYAVCTSETGIGVLADAQSIAVAAAGAVVNGVTQPLNWAFYGYDGNAKLLDGTWQTFTGAHEGLLDKSTTIEPGDIVVDLDVAGTSSLIDVMFYNEPSSSANQCAIGIFIKRKNLPDGNGAESKPTPLKNLPQAEYDAIDAAYDLIEIAAVGEGMINVCDANGNIAAGDLIVTCAVPGKGAKQPDDIVHSYTVARARESVTWADEPETTKQIACIFLCG